MCLKEIKNKTASIEVMTKELRIMKNCICDTSESLPFCGGGKYLSFHFVTFYFHLYIFSILLEKILIFSHMKPEINVTSPDHRLRNPNNPEASLFSRLHLMQNYRLINDRFCLQTAELAVEGNKSAWWGSSRFPVDDPFVTEVPGAKSKEHVTHVKMYSCTWVE